jgi:hypothetical protein
LKSVNQNRRRFPRLDITEEARVYDEGGRELGTLSKVGGGGLTLDTASPEIAQSLAIGNRLRITITEPGSRATNVVEVVVRNKEAASVGFEFVSSVPDE